MNDNQKYYKMDYEESEQFICECLDWDNHRFAEFASECKDHFLEMNFDDREEIKYLKTSYEFQKWFFIYFDKRNQEIVEEVISWDIEQNCWVFKEQIGMYKSAHKARNSAAFKTFYSYFIKDYSNMQFDKEHYLRNFNTPVNQDSEVVKEVEQIIFVPSKKKTTQESIWKRIFAQLMSIII